jgi:hypothetical protein
MYMVLRKIFGPQKAKKTGSGDGEDYNSDHIKKNEMGGACGAYWGGRGACRVLVGRSGGKNHLEKPMPRWKDDIKMDIQEVGGGRHGLIWLRIGPGGGTCDCGDEPSDFIKCGEFLD